MNVPLKWLADHVDLADVALPELVERLTLAGLEVTGVRLLGLPTPAGLKAKVLEPGPVWDRDKVVTALVRKIDKHPNADKLKLVELDYGTGTPKTVVTGAPNIAVGESGQKVILGLRGTRYFMEEEDKATKQSKKVIKTLEPKELRGIPNDAMCMSNFELGVSDEHEGIILLEADAPVGVPAVDLLGEAVLEIDVLPNMARCLSMIGVAREVAALFGKTVRVPAATPAKMGGPIAGKVKVEIVDAKLCSRYTAAMIENVTVGPAPGWMQRRLTHAGMRPINNLVDVTNYAMLEWGQPLHAFDYDILVKRAGGKAPTIIVRPAKDGEILKTLDGQDRTLTPETLVIADTAGAIALAGVMGGAETEVTTATKTVLLESASFDFVSVRRTAHRFALFSEASTRFSRGVHPELAPPASQHAARLIAESGGGTMLTGTIDAYPAPLPAQIVTLRRAEIRRLLGVDFPDAEVERVLAALQFTLTKVADGWQATVPLTRLDIQAGAADLIEELVRTHGYDRLPSILLSGELPPQRNNRVLVLEDTVRDTLANAGLQECVTYSLTAKDGEAKLGVAGPWVELVNPISPERSVMRTSLLTNLLEAAEENLKHEPAVKMFEVGPVYLPKAGEKLPVEPRRLALVLSGRRATEAWDAPSGGQVLDFFDLKGVIERLAAALHLPGVAVRSTKEVAYLHPGRSGELFVNGKAVGCFGELHPKTAAAFKLSEHAVLAADLDLEAILAAAPERFAYVAVPQHQAALRDVAVVVDEGLTNESVVAEIRAAGGELLAGVRLFDVYRGDSIPAGKKSLAYALTYQADRTLKDTEIDKAHKQVENRLVHVLKASIRGK
ncbi:MAG TPA: phenylalanine--tRNA ligase subunit beta [Gemmataceae bacterium]|jgi:phenylalanyl-tRNA synthetase beta chain|nr:phenylalanine--tRNA ligase subunit beta [Gemmataceae bacterium]